MTDTPKPEAGFSACNDLLGLLNELRHEAELIAPMSGVGHVARVLTDAADEIERLKAWLTWIGEHTVTECVVPEEKRFGYINMPPSAGARFALKGHCIRDYFEYYEHDERDSDDLRPNAELSRPAAHELSEPSERRPAGSA